MSWKIKAFYKDQLAQESGAVIMPLGRKRYAFGLVYPNDYYIGMSNLGFQIIYKTINEQANFACERAFLPNRELEEEYIRSKTPLLTMENQRPLYNMDIIGFALSFEMDYFNFLRCMKLAKIPLRSSDRTDMDPLIIIGGPCATFNPEPLADFADVFVIGEGENTVQDILAVYEAKKEEKCTKEEILLHLAKLDGVYVPRFYEPIYNEDGTLSEFVPQADVPKVITRQWVHNLDGTQGETVVMTPDTEFGKLYLIEVARGCGRHCRFCMAGYSFRNPRVRSLEEVKSSVLRAKPHMNKVGLMGAAISDYPWIDELSAFIREQDMTLSVASLRADSLTDGLASALADSGQKTITLAPEAATRKLRQVINKGITEQDLYQATELAIEKGIKNVKLYIMIGLPYETDEDIDAIIELAKNLQSFMRQHGSKGLLTLSVNPFIPKPFTPFQWLPMAERKSVENKLKHLQKSLQAEKKIQVLIESPKEAYVQGVLSRGDRRLGEVLISAIEAGGSKAFIRALKNIGLTEDFYLYRTRDRQEVFPWSHIDIKVTTDYLWKELENAQNRIHTIRCFDGCRRCGVCQ